MDVGEARQISKAVNERKAEDERIAAEALATAEQERIHTLTEDLYAGASSSIEEAVQAGESGTRFSFEEPEPLDDKPTEDEIAIWQEIATALSELISRLEADGFRINAGAINLNAFKGSISWERRRYILHIEWASSQVEKESLENTVQ